MPTESRARWAAIGLLIACATLPLQWQTLAVVPGLGTLRYLHIGAVLMLVCARPSMPMISAILKASRPVLEGSIAFLSISILTAIGWGSDWSDFLQRTVYLVLGLLAGACLLMVFTHESAKRLLFWASPVTLVVFMAEFGLAMETAGVNPLKTIENAIINSDPRVIEFALFRRSFNASPDASDVRSNARHEIFAALIIVFCISLAIGAVSRATQVVLVLSAVVTLALLVISQSRSVMLAVALALAVAFVRVVVTRRVRTGTLFLAALIIGTVIVAVPTVGKLIITRITQTKSYDYRIGAFDLSTHEILQRLIFGGTRLDRSTHTLVGDASLRGGLICGLASAVIVLGFVIYAVRNIRDYVLTGSGKNFAAILALSIVLVRCFTAGGGQLQLSEWVGFALTLALWITRGQQATVTAVAEPSPAERLALAAARRPALTARR